VPPDDRDPAERRAGIVDTPTSASVLRTGLALSTLGFAELWTAQLALGGALSKQELRAVLLGDRELTAHEHDVVAQALNDHFTERGQNHPVPYSDELTIPPRREF
jgi:hypothetical protein